MDDVEVQDIIESKDCILLLLGFNYLSSVNDTASIKKLKDHAIQLAIDEDDFNKNWLFVYEVSPQNSLKDDWKAMKKAKVSFVRNAL